MYVYCHFIKANLYLSFQAECIAFLQLLNSDKIFCAMLLCKLQRFLQRFYAKKSNRGKVTG